VSSLSLAAVLAAVLAGAASAPPTRPPQEPAAAQPAATRLEPDAEVPPPGSRSEQALWRRASETNDRVTIDRAGATRLQLRAKVVVDRIRALAEAGVLPAPRAAALEREVLGPWRANVELLRSQWPVDPTRACRYDQLYFESAMRLPGEKARALQVAETGKVLEECLARADAVLARLAASSQQLAHETAEVEKALAVYPVASPSAPAAK
jgi:hypothetical protein